MEFEIKNTSDTVSDGVKILIHGQSGSGKSTQLGTIDGRVLILSAESGLLVLKDKKIDVIDISSIEMLGNIYIALKNGELKYDTVCIDSLSEVGDIVITELENDEYYSNPSNAFVKWSEYTKKMTSIVKLFRDLKGINVIFTALTESVEANGSIKYTPQVPAKKFQQKLVSMFDFVIYMTVDKDGKRIFHHDESNMWVAKSRAELVSKAEVSDTYNVGSILNKLNNKKGK